MDLLTANDRPGAYPESFYATGADLLDVQPPAQGDVTCDVCVIGGGFTGLSTALHLAQRGYAVRLVEAHRQAGKHAPTHAHITRHLPLHRRLHT